jgi:arylsulfatase A-like enzyme
LIFGCTDKAAEFERPPSRVVLVTLDTLRADHMSAYGHPIQTTPFLDSLAQQGLLFRHAFSQSATTKPSHASIFTSLYATQHGVEQDGVVLDRSFQTLAEMLSDHGFRTAAFVSIDAPLGDPHRPMSPPREHLDRVNRMIDEIGQDEYTATLEERGIPSNPDIQAEIAEYDAEILYVDTEIERLFSDVQAAGLGEDAMWIITGDHGQGLGAHEWFGHSK